MLRFRPHRHRAAALLKEQTSRRSTASSGGPRMSQKMPRVLMVDDAGLFRLLEASFLRRLGCDIVPVAGWPDLLDKARRDRPDLIVIDADSPGIDAPACLRTLKGDPFLRGTRVVVVSAPGRLGSCFEAGADAALARPFAPEALEMALGSLGGVGHRRGPRRSARLMAQIAPEPGGARRRCRVKDISRTGLFLALPEPLPLETAVTLSLRLPIQAHHCSIRARGVVVRQVQSDPDSHLIAGVGVRFLDMPPETESLIARYVGTVNADAAAVSEPTRP